jgi:transcription initiation factor IIE alpha subunit
MSTQTLPESISEMLANGASYVALAPILGVRPGSVHRKLLRMYSISIVPPHVCREVKAIDALRSCPQTASDLAPLLGIKAHGARRMLHRLRERGDVEFHAWRSGPGRGALEVVWRVVGAPK